MVGRPKSFDPEAEKTAASEAVRRLLEYDRERVYTFVEKTVLVYANVIDHDEIDEL